MKLLKNIFSILVIILVLTSCSKEKTISEELVGNWLYERETNINFSATMDPNTLGDFHFDEIETGTWNQSNPITKKSAIQWKLQDNDTKLAITNLATGDPNFAVSTTVYDLVRVTENNFRLRLYSNDQFMVEPMEITTYFDNVVLMRME